MKLSYRVMFVLAYAHGAFGASDYTHGLESFFCFAAACAFFGFGIIGKLQAEQLEHERRIAAQRAAAEVERDIVTQRVPVRR